MNHRLIDTAPPVPTLRMSGTGRQPWRPERYMWAEDQLSLLHISQTFYNFACGTLFRTCYIEALCSFLLPTLLLYHPCRPRPAQRQFNHLSYVGF